MLKIPWWAKIALKFVPQPWSTVIDMILKIIEQLPSHKVAELGTHKDAMAFTAALNQCVGDQCHLPPKL